MAAPAPPAPQDVQAAAQAKLLEGIEAAALGAAQAPREPTTILAEQFKPIDIQIDLGDGVVIDPDKYRPPLTPSVARLGGLAVGLYDTLNAVDRGQQERVVAYYGQHFGAPLPQLPNGAFKLSGFTDAARNKRMRELERAAGLGRPATDAEHRSWAEEANRYADAEVQRALQMGAYFVTPTPTELDIGRRAVATLPEPVKGAVADAWAMGSAAGLVPTSRLKQGAMPEGYTPDPLGYGALVLDTMAAAALPWGRSQLEAVSGTVQARPDYGTADLILRPLSAAPTTLAALATWYNTDVDPRAVAATDALMAEALYGAGKKLGEETWGEDHWMSSVLGLGLGAAGLAGDFVVPGGPIELGLVGAGALRRTVIRLGVSPTRWAMLNAARDLEAAADAAATMKSAEGASVALGPAVEMATEGRLLVAASGGTENLYLQMARAQEDVDAAEAHFGRLDDALQHGRKVDPNDYAAAERQAIVARGALDEALEQHRVAQKVGASPKDVGVGERVRKADLDLAAAESKLAAMDVDALARKVRDPHHAPTANAYLGAAQDARLAERTWRQEAGRLSRLWNDGARSASGRHGYLTAAPPAWRKKAAGFAAKGNARVAARWLAKADALDTAIANALPPGWDALLNPSESRRVQAAVQAGHDAVVLRAMAKAAESSSKTGLAMVVPPVAARSKSALVAAEIGRWNSAMTPLEVTRAHALQTRIAAGQAVMGLRSDVLRNIADRRTAIAAVGREMAQRLRDMAEAYRLSRGTTRAPNEIAAMLVGRTAARTPTDAADLLAAVDMMFLVARDPQSHRMGLQKFKEWGKALVGALAGADVRGVATLTASGVRSATTRTLFSLARAVDPRIGRYGNVGPRLAAALDRTENRFRGGVQDVLHLMVDAGTDAAGTMHQLDAWMGATAPVRYGGRLLGRTPAGATGANVIVRGATPQAPWDLVLEKYGSVVPAKDGGPSSVDLAAQNEDIRGLAFMWVGPASVSPDGQAKLVAHALAGLGEGMGPAAFRQHMHDMTVAERIRPDRVPAMVAYRQALAANWTASSTRLLDHLNDIVGDATVKWFGTEAVAAAAHLGYKVEDYAALERVANELGVPLLPKGQWRTTQGAEQFMAPYLNVSKDQPVWLNKAAIDRMASYGTEFVKATEKYAGWDLPLPWFMVVGKLWKRSVVAGLLVPDAGYFFQNAIGDWMQTAREVGFVRATGTLFGNLPTMIPGVGRWLNARAAAMYAKNPRNVLPGITEVLLNPRLAAFLEGQAGEIVTRSGKRISFDEARQWVVEEGVWATFAQAEDLAGLMRGSSNGFWGKVAAWSDTIGDFADQVARRQRTALFLDELVRTGDPRRAGKLVRNALYDYANFVTDFERATISRIAPFWSYWKNSLYQQIRGFSDLVTDPSVTAVLDGQLAKIRRMERTRDLLTGLWNDDDDPKMRARLRFAEANRPETHRGRFTGPLVKLKQSDAEWLLLTQGRDVDTAAFVFSPDSYTDSLEVLGSLATLLAGAAYEADRWAFGGAALPYALAEGWEQFAIEPITKLLGPHVLYPFVAAMESAGFQTGAFGVKTQTTAHPGYVALERATGMSLFGLTDKKDGLTRMGWFQATVLMNTPGLNEVLLLSRNAWFDNLGRIPRDNSTAMGQWLRTLGYGTAGLLRVNPRLYSARKQFEYADQSLTRAIQDRIAEMEGGARAEWREVAPTDGD